MQIVHRKPKAMRELVYWHNAPIRRRMASIPVYETRPNLPKESRYAHDNAPKRIAAMLWSTMFGAGFGLVVGLLAVIGMNGLVLTSEDLVIIAVVMTCFGLLGTIIGKNIVYPRILVKPRYMVRANKVAGKWKTEALEPDVAEDEMWQKYLLDLREQVRKSLEDAGESPEKADTLIPNPAISGSPVARYDAYSMFNIEECRAEKLVIQGWNPNKENRVAIMKMAGGMIIAIGGVIVLALLLNDARKKEAIEAAAQLVMHLWS